jgi:hypothetical protein
VKHFYSDDVRIYGNPMNGNDWDVDRVTKLPKGAVRNMDFLKK